MKVRLPRGEKEERVFSEIEKGFDRLNEYALPRAGGAAGQALTKASARDFDYAWSGTGLLPLDLRSGWLPYGSGWRNPVVSMSGEGIVVVNAIVRAGTVAAGTSIALLPQNMWPSGYVGDFLCLNSSGTISSVYITPAGLIFNRTPFDASWTMMNFTYKVG